jgi:hypothetical protein
MPYLKKSRITRSSSVAFRGITEVAFFNNFRVITGEIAVDPENGTVLRPTLEADLKPTDPMVKANIVVEA